MDHIRLIVAVDERLGHVEQTACQRERSDNARKDRTVLDQAHRLFNSVDVDLGAACADGRHFERLGLFHALVFFDLGGDDRAGHGRHLIVGYPDGRAEAFGFDR